MVAKTTITCDNCASDLSDAGPRPDYLLSLQEHRMASTSNIQFAVHVVPQLNHVHHFCGFGCLQAWLTKRNA